MDAQSLYREEILDHYQNPRHFGKLKGADKTARQTNPLCGDDITIFVRWDKRDRRAIGDIRFEGKGCAICLAGASILTEYALGKTKEELTKMSQSDMLKLLGIEVSETRKKCAMLSLGVLKDVCHIK